MQCDILILGSGPGGSLLATILARAGLRVAIVDRASHPRFAIGESSTPLADMTLKRLAVRYDLPELVPLTTYGAWKSAYPELTCGLKRGFSYFGHQRGQPFNPKQQLLVAASADDENSDTHWLRSDVDAFLFRVARSTCELAISGADYELTKSGEKWRVAGNAQESFDVEAPFVVDATGHAAVVINHLGVPAVMESCWTSGPAAVFAHFRNVCPVGNVLGEMNVDCHRHPFAGDAAAVHHVLEDGWMWQLRFDDGTVSAGLMMTEPARATDPARLWREILAAYSFIGRQFRNAAICRPGSDLVVIPRVRRCRSRAAGADWAALPMTVGFVDPLHSTGIAHTLAGVERLAAILLASGGADADALQAYSRSVVAEFTLIRQLVDGCYASLPHFEFWSVWCMLYFAAVTSMEQGAGGAFLLADDLNFRRMVNAAEAELQCSLDRQASCSGSDQFERWLRAAISPWNPAGLLNPNVDGMYAHTTARRTT